MSRQHTPALLPKAKRSSCGIPWLVCGRCGLVYTKARAAVLAARAECPGAEDPAPIPGKL